MNYRGKVLSGPSGAKLIPVGNEGQKKPMSFVLYEKMGVPVPQEAIESALKKHPSKEDELKAIVKNYNSQFEAFAARRDIIFTKYCQVVDELDKLHKYKKCYSNLKIASNRTSNVDILVDKVINDFKLFLEKIE